MKIGLLDSGIGGLTVLQQALAALPEVEYLYYADTDHVPYGTKTKEEIIRYVDEAVVFLIRQGVKAIVIACNTATIVAIEYIRGKYDIPVLGMEPAVKLAMDMLPQKRVMIMATPLSIKEDKLHNLISRVDVDHRVDLLPMPGLVVLAEAGRFDTEEVKDYLIHELTPYNLYDYSTLVLGCTHFNYFKDTLRSVFPADVEFIDGIGGTVNHLKNVLIKEGLTDHRVSGIQYFISGRPVTGKDQIAFFKGLLKRSEQMLLY